MSPGGAQEIEQRFHLLARAGDAAGVDAEVGEGLLEEALAGGLRLVEAPPGDARPTAGVHVVVQPVPGERALAEAAERTDDEQGVIGVAVEPGGELAALRVAAGENEHPSRRMVVQ